MASKIDKIKVITEEFFQSLGWQTEVNIEISEKIIFVNIDAENPSLLIGRDGENLRSIQHILRILINKELEDYVHLVLDVNNYKKSQQSNLEQILEGLIREVMETGLEKELEPMNSYERRVVHVAVKKIDGITSESRGDGIERRVVIKKA